MSHQRLQKQRNLYVIVTTLALVVIWIIWIVTTDPYAKTEEVQKPGIWDELASSTEELKLEYYKQKEQLDMLGQYITQHASSITSTPEIDSDIILEMKDRIEQSSSTEN